MTSSSLVVVLFVLLACAKSGDVQSLSGNGQSGLTDLEQSSLNVLNGYIDISKGMSVSDEDFIDATTETVAANLKDPDSAQFRSLRVVPIKDGKVVCGQVNGKNSYGGYVGFKNFYGVPLVPPAFESTDRRSKWITEESNYGFTLACRT